MRTVRGRSGKSESAISIFLLAVLVLITLGVLHKQSKYNMADFGIVAAPDGLPTGSNEDLGIDPGSLVPSGFKLYLPSETYVPDTLYEKINGKAPLYLESGFEKLTTQRYADEQDQSLMAELYIFEMGTVENAFSVFSVQRRPDGTPVELFEADYGYKTPNALYFIMGEYYVEIIGYAESGRLTEAMLQVAEKIKVRLAAEGDSKIAGIEFLSADGLVEGSVRLYLKNAFGFEGLTNVLAATYKVGHQNVTIYFSKRADANEAEEIAKRYRKFLKDNGATIVETDSNVLNGAVFDFYGMREIVFTTGTFIGGVHQADSAEPAEKMAKRLYKKLGEVSNKH